jgi:DNA end-binding protein Ku
MPQAVWTGSLSFGLVNIPVKLYAATSPKRVRFHQYEAGTGRRIRYRRVAEAAREDEVYSEPVSPAGPESLSEPPAADELAAPPQPAETEREVDWADVVKGYELEPGRVVTVDADELEAVAPEKSRVLEIEQFVDLSEIDPVHFEKSYYLVPQRATVTERPYSLLFRAMEETQKVAIGRFVMRTKEYLVAVRPGEHVLMLETLFYADEVRDPKELWYPAMDEPDEHELRMANQFVNALSGRWDPARHRDEHRDRLLDLLHEKAAELPATPKPAAEPAPVAPVTDLMDALKASVEAAVRARRNEQDRETG